MSTFYAEERRALVVLFALATVLDTIRTAGEMQQQGIALARYAMLAGPFVAALFVGLTTIYFAQQKLWSWVGIAIIAAVSLVALLGWTVKVDLPG